MSFREPVSAKLTQAFGANPTFYKSFGYKGHNGQDYAAKSGTPVYAADEGTVKFEGWGQKHSWMGEPAGICVLLNNVKSHSGYAHLSKTVVNTGQKVKKGQLIGYSGNTGASTGAHLHFEMLPLRPNFKNGYAGRIDPAPYMDKPKPVVTVAQQLKSAKDKIKKLTAERDKYKSLLDKLKKLLGV